MKPLLPFFLLLLSLTGMAKAPDEPFKGRFYNQEQDIIIALNLYDTTIVAERYEFLGKLNGYITGNLYDSWFVTSFRLQKGKALVRFSNDMGADTQEVQFTLGKQGELIYQAVGANVLRRAVNKKWEKVPAKMVLVPKPR